MGNNEGRKFACFKENKEKIEEIKKKYNDMEMTDETANKIRKLEITNNVLSAAMSLAGIATAIDLIIPDPLIGLDEAILAAITAGIGGMKAIIKSHIKDLTVNGNTDLEPDDVNKLTSILINISNAFKNKKGAKTL